MRALELDEQFKDFKIESGHNVCHPETCSCWDIRVYDLNGNNVLNTNSVNRVIEFCTRSVNA